MKRLSVLFALGLVLAISGCQTVSDITGKGPITLSFKVEKAFKDWKDGKHGYPFLFAVTADGSTGYQYYYCPVSSANYCQGLVLPHHVVQECENKFKQPCKLLGDGPYVVWDGPVSYESEGTQPVTSPEAEKASLCFLALNGSNWAKTETHEKYAKQAQQLGYSLDDCIQAANAK